MPINTRGLVTSFPFVEGYNPCVMCLCRETVCVSVCVCPSVSCVLYVSCVCSAVNPKREPRECVCQPQPHPLSAKCAEGRGWGSGGVGEWGWGGGRGTAELFY